MKIHSIKQTPIRVITKRAFWSRVTDVKHALILDLADNNSLLRARLRELDGADYIDLDNESLVKGFDDLESEGLFTKEDKDKIFADGSIEESPSYKKY